VQSGYREVFANSEESSFETPADQDMSRRFELSWQLQNNDKKEIRRCKEDFMSDLKWQ
jgi:hypothetical protein